MFLAPPAHTDGDTFVHFPESDVLHLGDVFRTTSYPIIDVYNGGTLAGTIEALNLALSLAGPETKVIPGSRSQGGGTAGAHSIPRHDGRYQRAGARPHCRRQDAGRGDGSETFRCLRRAVGKSMPCPKCEGRMTKGQSTSPWD